ncbi:MAG TPA: hypothetical protein VEB66_01915 [Opitutaceae bacterium]|nr:hypothetical protein [Opitutaceae bacterium]
MPSLQQLLRKRSDAEPVTAPLWHPNFRNYERLPDTKTVRTAFFVNAVAGGIAACLLLYAGFNELKIRQLNQQIAEAQQQIDTRKGQDDQAKKLSQAFVEEEKKLSEAVTFTAIAMPPTEFVALLGETLPKDIAIEFFDMRLAEAAGPTVVLRGMASGSPEQASGAASSYADVFRTHPRFIAAVDKADITNVNRDTQRGVITFEVVLRLKTPGKEKKS